jgi:hypothetical protein
VWGHRRELAPGQSVYTRVLDLDWVYPVGDALYFGGDVLVRRDALADVDGFDPTLPAGEEPELCARLRARGWLIAHIDAPMTRHDLAVRSLRAYARRAYRSGVAYAEVAQRMRQLGDPLWQHEARRDLQHGLLFLAAPWLFIAALLLWPAAALCLALAALALLARTAQRSAWKAPGQRWLQWQYAVHVHLQKVPALFGQLAWWQAQRRSRQIGLIEYKDTSPASSDGSALPLRAWCKQAMTTVLVPLAIGWQRLVRDCSAVQRPAAGSTAWQQAQQALAAHSPPASHAARPLQLLQTAAGDWLLAEVVWDAADTPPASAPLDPAIVPLRRVGAQWQVLDAGVWSGDTGPWHPPVFIRRWLQRQVPALPADLALCLDPRWPAFAG